MVNIYFFKWFIQKKKKKEHLYFVLSAKWWINECEIASFRSLMYIRKSKGPGTDPCGTPYDITVLLERVLFIEVCCFWFDR